MESTKFGLFGLLNLLLVRVERRIGEALSVVLAEEAAVLQLHMVDLVTRALSVLLVPLLLGGFAFPSDEKKIVRSSG